MKRCLFTALAALAAWWGIGVGGVHAQSWQLGTYGPPQIRSRSPVSPYINMTGRGNLATDYYGIVRPQMDTNRSIYDLQQGINNLNTAGNPGSMLPLNSAVSQTGLQTGHPVGVFNYQRFFPLSYGSTSMGVQGPIGAPGFGTPYSSNFGGTTGTTQTQTFFPGVMNSYRLR